MLNNYMILFCSFVPAYYVCYVKTSYYIVCFLCKGQTIIYCCFVCYVKDKSLYYVILFVVLRTNHNILLILYVKDKSLCIVKLFVMLRTKYYVVVKVKLS